MNGVAVLLWSLTYAVMARLLPEDPARPEAEKHKELITHLTSDAALRPKDDALLFEQTVDRTGGPDTPWAKAVRRGLEQQADPLRQQHRAEMNERFQSRGYAVTQLLEKTRAQRQRAENLEKPKREKRLAAIAAGQRREMERIDKRFALESFVSWSVRKRQDVEREAPFLEKSAERREQHKAQRAAYDGAKREQKLDAVAQKPPAPARTPSDEHEWLAERYHAEKADLDLALHVRQELRLLGDHDDNKLPTAAEIVAQFADLRTAIRQAERRYGQSEAKLMAEILYDRGRSRRQGRGIG